MFFIFLNKLLFNKYCFIKLVVVSFNFYLFINWGIFSDLVFFLIIGGWSKVIEYFLFMYFCINVFRRINVLNEWLIRCVLLVVFFNNFFIIFK